MIHRKEITLIVSSLGKVDFSQGLQSWPVIDFYGNSAKANILPTHKNIPEKKFTKSAG